MNPLAWLYFGWFWLCWRIIRLQMASPTMNVLASFKP